MSENDRDYYIECSDVSFDQDQSDDFPKVREDGFQITQPADTTAQNVPEESLSNSVSTVSSLSREDVQLPNEALRSLIFF